MLYRQVKRQLINDIQSGSAAPGAALPNEKDLAQRFQVSVGTVRRAVDELVAEHVLLRQQGRGTFVGKLDRDSNAACLQDNVREEDLVWPVAPEPGYYSIYVDMWSACGAQSAPFDVRLIVDGEVRVTKSAILSGQDADMGVAPSNDKTNITTACTNAVPGLCLARWSFD